MSWIIYYTIEQGEATVLGCLGDGDALTLPGEIDGCPVVRLGPGCFREPAEETGGEELRLVQGPPPASPAGNRRLRYLTLPDRLREIGSRGLAHCSGLARLGLPPTLRVLGERVFDHCRALTRVDLPEGLTELPAYTFADCRGLERLSIPNSVTAVGNQCFYNCTRLEELAFPAALRSIGSGIFMNCSRLKRLSLPTGISLSVLLADLYQRLEVTVCSETHTTLLLFPEYAYEFEDIVMPRQFRTITYGSGGRYRECIVGERIDLGLYDSLFRVAMLEETPETVALLAFLRLMSPAELRPEAQTRYLDYLRDLLDALAPEVFQRGSDTELTFLLERCELEVSHLDTLLTCAEAEHAPRLVSRILEQKRRMAPSGADKVFEL